ncbi:MAG: class I SAM-dependent methyltransferase [Bdellovibrionota bacterium]|nr:class I SAM-dependent methyltransferase [Bdellovibrionota bacterium]
MNSFTKAKNVLSKIYDNLLNLKYDYQFSLKTNSSVQLINMEVKSESIIHARHYQATHYRLFFKIMNQLNLPWNKFNFIDFGSGKGRCLLMASMLGFKKVIGIEFAKDLCETAEDNKLSLQKNFPHIPLSPIEIINEDALNFFPKTKNNVFFFYNPFDGVILKEVLQNCSDYSPKGSRDYYIYINPLRDYLFEPLRLKEIIKLENSNHNKKVKIFTNS